MVPLPLSYRSVIVCATIAWVTLKAVRRLFCSKPTPPPGAAVFITGAGTGIGRDTALLLNSKGFRVFAGVISESEGEKLRSEATEKLNLIPIVCDVSSVDSVRAAKNIVESATQGRLWGIVNNAGINYADGPVEFVPLDRVRRVFEVNVMGIYHVLQAFLPLVRASRGRVVNIASVNGFFTWQDHTPYCVSKHGVEALTDGLRMEVEPFGVSVSVIEPGGIKTPIWEATKETVRKCQEEMGPECHKVYGRKSMDVLISTMTEVEKRNSPPIVIARAIHHALASPMPKLRYTLGAGAGTLNFLKRYLLSDGLFHTFVKVAFGFKTRVIPADQLAR